MINACPKKADRHERSPSGGVETLHHLALVGAPKMELAISRFAVGINMAVYNGIEL
jgi:hypothetical protein